MLKAYLHDDAGLSSAWAPWYSHEYIAYCSIHALDQLIALPSVPVLANPRLGQKRWPTGPRHIDMYKESYRECRKLDPLWSFDHKKRNGDFASDVPAQKSIEPWKIFVIYSTEPDYYADEGLFLHKNQHMTDGSRGWRHMHFKLMGTSYGIAPQSFRVHRDLARMVFERGNVYWGWRYLARTGHYLADLGNPFHVKTMPGIYLFRNLFAAEKLHEVVSALHQSYEIYVERRFREGFSPFFESLFSGARQGRDASKTVDVGLNAYIRRAEKRHNEIFYCLLSGFGGELVDIFLTTNRESGRIFVSQANRCAAEAARLLFSQGDSSSLSRLDSVTCDCLRDVGWMQGALLRDFIS